MQVCTFFKSLALFYVSAFSFLLHITFIHKSDQLKKAYAKASPLRRIRRFLPHDAMIKLYKAFILPHLQYCSPLFVGIGTGQRNRLEDGNCYILRTLIGNKKSMSYDDLLTMASMTSLYCRRLHQALILLFKCLNITGPIYIGSLCKTGIHRID